MLLPSLLRADPPLSPSPCPSAQKLTRELDNLNARRDGLNDKVVDLAQSGSDLAALEAASREMAAVQEDIDTKSERWLELAELAGDI